MIRLPLLAIGISIGVPVRISVHISLSIYITIDIDIHIGMVAASVTPIAIICQDRPPSHPHPEADKGSCRHCCRRRVIVARVRWITRIDNCGIVLRDINNFRLSGLNLDDLVGDDDSFLFDDISDHRVSDHDYLLLGSF